MSTSLYDISADLQTIHDAISDQGGELTPELELALDRLNLQLSDKVFNIGRWLKNLEANKNAIQAEILRLHKKESSCSNLIKRLSEYTRISMEKADKKKLDFQTFAVAVQKNPPSVLIEDESKIPAQYVKIITETEIDRAAILKDLKEGKEVPGARLVIDRTHLRVR